MAIQYKADYVYSPKAELGNYFFIGTRKFIFTYPIKAEDRNGEKIEFFINGEKPDVFIKNILDDPDMTPDLLEEKLKELKANFEGPNYIDSWFFLLEDYPFMKVSTVFTGSSLLIGKKKIGFDKHIVSNLGKEYKKDIKAFYHN